MPDAPVVARRPPAAPGGRRLRLGRALYRFATRLGWAEPELNGLAAVVRPGDTVLDVGAALGMYTVPLAYLTGPAGRVDSFEPQLRGYLTVKLLRTLTGARCGSLRRLALGPSAGHGEIVVPLRRGFPIFGHGHLSPPGAEHRAGRRTATAVDTVDAWVAREELPRIAFIKIDVEGYEPEVILGATAVIDRDRPGILMEIEDRHLCRYGTTAAQFLAEMRTRWPDYRMFTWSGRDWIVTERVTPDIRNYLFATPDRLDGVATG